MSNVQIILELIDINGIEGIFANEKFKIEVNFFDLTNNNLGVFSGYLDLIYDPTKLQINNIIYSNLYNSNAKSGTIINSGLVDEVGSMVDINQVVQGNSIILPQDNTIFTLEVTALTDLTVNSTTITTDTAENPKSEITIFGNDNDQRNDTEYGSLTIGNVSTNTPPIISNIDDININLGADFSPINFTINDQETEVDNLTIEVESSNSNLLNKDDINITRNGENITLDINNLPTETGTTTITLNVYDGEITSQETFDLTFRENTPNQSTITIKNGENSLAFLGSSDDIIDLSQENSPERDRIYGGSGNDTIKGGTNDVIFGGKGNDHIDIITGGGHLVSGGNGQDTFLIADETQVNTPNSPNLITDFNSEEDKIALKGFNLNSQNISNIITLNKNNTNILNPNNNNQTIAIIVGVTNLDPINDFDFIE